MTDAKHIAISRIGFGCSRLHYLRRPTDRQELLAAALDAGLTHFDVAPTYSYGLAERELGAFLKGRRGAVTVATKWGLPTVPLADSVPRAAMSYAATLIAAARKVRPPRRERLTPALLQDSIEASLRRLGTDYVDILWMHEPDAEDIDDPPALRGALDALVARGLVRGFGVAGYGGPIATVLNRFGGDGLLVQCDEKDWPDDRVPDVTFGAISRGPQFRGQPSVGGEEAVARVRAALARRPRGSVLISTTRPANLLTLARAVDD